MDLARFHEVLLKAHQQQLREPAFGADSLDGASCRPHLKHLAQLAMGTAAEGSTAERWRSELIGGLGPQGAPLVAHAESCMRDVGLWP